MSRAYSHVPSSPPPYPSLGQSLGSLESPVCLFLPPAKLTPQSGGMERSFGSRSCAHTPETSSLDNGHGGQQVVAGWFSGDTRTP